MQVEKYCLIMFLGSADSSVLIISDLFYKKLSYPADGKTLRDLLTFNMIFYCVACKAFIDFRHEVYGVALQHELILGGRESSDYKLDLSRRLSSMLTGRKRS